MDYIQNQIDFVAETAK